MYQISTIWGLWDRSQYVQDEVNSIALRGYKREAPILLPADLASQLRNGKEGIRRLTVAQIASGHCPTKRDIYLEVKKLAKGKRAEMTWGRMAGRLIEEYVLGSMELLAPAAKRPMRIRDKNIGRMAARSSTTFWASRRSLLEKLDAKATSKLEGRARLEFTLEQTTRYEFALLAADYGLRKRRLRRFSPVDLRAGIETSNSATRISPSPDLGLSKANTPDFVVLKPDLAVGEIKTGIKLEPYHLHTIAGYALAYESQHAVDVNFGVVYFFETHVSQMRLNHTYFFVIDDFLRRKFLDIRDHVYALLMEDGPPPLADYEKDCKYCKFRKACYPPVNG